MSEGLAQGIAHRLLPGGRCRFGRAVTRPKASGIDSATIPDRTTSVVTQSVASNIDWVMGTNTICPENPPALAIPV